MVLVDIVWMAVQLSLFKVIYAHTPSINGWTEPKAFFFLGVFFASDAIFTTFFQRNFWNFSDLVNKGELDILLTKPIHPLFLALTRTINLTGVFNIGLGLAIAIRYATPAGFPGGLAWGWFFPWLLVGVVASVLLRFAFSVWIFWTERNWAITRLYFAFFSIADKPDVMFPPMLRFFLKTILPFSLIGAVPARALLEGLSLQESALVAFVLLAFFGINRELWRRGLMRYQSASS